uniref:Gibberellin-regulated protein 13 n=1 Tax=Arabidopsis thaliana TaxID=3702 RepID=GASAD_ARATH|nr:RecName: Full=Gibberellin-regulated protein 13; AltName: Full=GAST1 protein homolog 13; Flags: Precursor [Arabidopsis thaliana]
MATKLSIIVFSIVVLHLLLSAHMHFLINVCAECETKSAIPPLLECGPRCGDRCSNTQYKKPCLFFCNKCCNKCLCVPPGTYGNKQVCPCYNNWKTKSGGPKCP